MADNEKDCAWHAKHRLIAAQAQIHSADIYLRRLPLIFGKEREALISAMKSLTLVIETLDQIINPEPEKEQQLNDERNSNERED